MVKRYLVGLGVLVLAFAAAYLLIQLACRPSLGQLRREADSLAGAYSRDTAQLVADTLATDSILAEAGNHPFTPRVKTAVKKERASCARALRTCEQQKENYRQQIRALTPRLRVFGGLAHEGRLEAEAGAALRLGPGLEAELELEQPVLGDGDDGLTLNIRVRKYWRLF